VSNRSFLYDVFGGLAFNTIGDFCDRPLLAVDCGLDNPICNLIEPAVVDIFGLTGKSALNGGCPAFPIARIVISFWRRHVVSEPIALILLRCV